MSDAHLTIYRALKLNRVIQLSGQYRANSAEDKQSFQEMFWRSLIRLTHSARNAIIGSTRLARRAGTQQARSAMPNKSKATHVKMIGSELLTP